MKVVFTDFMFFVIAFSRKSFFKYCLNSFKPEILFTLNTISRNNGLSYLRKVKIYDINEIIKKVNDFLIFTLNTVNRKCVFKEIKKYD